MNTETVVILAGILTVAAVLWFLPLKAIVALVVAVVSGGLTYVSFDMGHRVDEVTVLFGVITVISAGITYGLAKSKGKSKVKAPANA